ncbi:acetyl-CoA carboxylase biotin carboxyl carrier protein subunit [Corynebacterium lizhenjunii]|uniref:Acetyl-CoA carboxylase biotin carboxyl carrier protein subunit n=1 Tax=Corynebacterium lizhenjunii TaxID=2709394 RepID=A0A7T0KFZ9_9CORY|nr:acetyl-CoA carboxylase biotin carboxyl carrier protein subunit [Corynebacterium lizhenjunii]QPK80093.1 acetyl-CoA carboxylase biotin carboxyl carrier protein subunit [Corynebacterium lizhenjunii]
MKICAPFAGIVRYHVQPGQRLAAGDVVATVEATKLEAPVPTPGPGVVQFLAQTDFSDVLGGDLLAVVGMAEVGPAGAGASASSSERQD